MGKKQTIQIFLKTLRISLDFCLPHLCSSVRSKSASTLLASFCVADRQKDAENWTTSTALWGSFSLRHTNRNSSNRPSLQSGEGTHTHTHNKCRHNSCLYTSPSHVENSRRNSVLASKELQDIPVERSKHEQVLLGLKMAVIRWPGRCVLSPGLLTKVSTQQQTGDAGEGGGGPDQARPPCVLKHTLYFQSTLGKTFLDLSRDVRHMLILCSTLILTFALQLSHVTSDLRRVLVSRHQCEQLPHQILLVVMTQRADVCQRCNIHKSCVETMI